MFRLRFTQLESMGWTLSCLFADDFSVFEDLQYSISNLDLASPESLSRLDTQVRRKRHLPQFMRQRHSF